MGMGMGVSIIGGTPVLMPVAKMMEAASAAASSRGGDRRSGGGGRWGGDDGEDRWAGDSPPSEDAEAHSRRRGRRDSGGSGSHMSRADSRDEGQAQHQAGPSPPQEEEPEEGELVIEPSSAPAVLPAPRKSRWGDLETEASPPFGVCGFGGGIGFGGRSGYAAASRADRWASRGGGERSVGGGMRDGGDGDNTSPQGIYMYLVFCAGLVLFLRRVRNSCTI